MESNCCEGIIKSALGGEACAGRLEALTIQMCKFAWSFPGTEKEGNI